MESRIIQADIAADLLQRALREWPDDAASDAYCTVEDARELLLAWARRQETAPLIDEPPMANHPRD